MIISICLTSRFYDLYLNETAIRITDTNLLSILPLLKGPRKVPDLFETVYTCHNYLKSNSFIFFVKNN